MSDNMLFAMSPATSLSLTSLCQIASLSGAVRSTVPPRPTCRLLEAAFRFVY
ncbi:MAG TPA: hypothetical protein VGJ00_08825 [Rhabdochlamydiaceae bacterium]